MKETKEKCVIVFITAASTKEARRLARGLLEARLAACVNIVCNVESQFRWQGKLDKADEVLLLVKTVKRLVPAVIREVKRLHSYDVPEIIALPIQTGAEDYLKWIRENVK